MTLRRGHLRNLGAVPEDIDTIVISHANLDHVFGTLAPDGSWVFPNARYVIGEQEWAYWMKPTSNSAISCRTNGSNDR